MYLLRTSPCFLLTDLLKSFDDILRKSLSAILNVALSEDQFTQASLPINSGGLGLRPSTNLAPSAFLASANGCRFLCAFITPNTHFIETHINEAIQTWTSLSNIIPSEIKNARPDVQKEWDGPIIEHQSKCLLVKLNDNDSKIRLQDPASRML